MRKPVFEVSDQARHKSGCTATEASSRLEISYLGSRGIVISTICSENKGPDQLRSYHAADLCLCFRICKKLVQVSHDMAHFTSLFSDFSPLLSSDLCS